jgi:hypothetical protein
MKPIITNSLQVIAVILITVSAIASAAPVPESSPEPARAIHKAETVSEPSSDEKSPETAETSSPEQIESPEPIVPVEPVAPKPEPQPVQDDRAPLGVSDRGGNGSCAAEILKYDWHQGVALAVASAESGLRPGIVNNTPSTGDYSVGCFQVNLYGANARTRPSEAELRDAAINVRWSYNNYVANGRSFIGQWGVCNSKVACH